LSQDEIAKFKLGEPRPVSFMDGIFMTAGQHKGAMLRTLLWKIDHLFKAILFVDDQRKHCDRVYEAFDTQGVDVVTIRYGVEDHHVKKFEESNKSQVIEAWKNLKNILSTIFIENYRESEPEPENDAVLPLTRDRVSVNDCGHESGARKRLFEAV